MWVLLMILSTVALGFGVLQLLRAMRERRDKKPAVAALAASPALFVAAILFYPSSPEPVQPQVKSPVTTKPIPEPEPLPEPVNAMAADIFQIGSKPSSLKAERQSREGERLYYAWNRPDLGGQVNTVWIAHDDWWVKISPPTFDPEDLGTVKSRNGNLQYVDGPLTGIIINSIDSQGSLHLWSPKFHARVFP